MQTLLDSPSSTTVRPSDRRRTAVGVTGFLACALPTIFTINLSRMLLVGELSEHRFHQLTGQGLLLCLLWLAVAGVRSRRRRCLISSASRSRRRRARSCFAAAEAWSAIWN